MNHVKNGITFISFSRLWY